MANGLLAPPTLFFIPCKVCGPRRLRWSASKMSMGGLPTVTTSFQNPWPVCTDRYTSRHDFQLSRGPAQSRQCPPNGPQHGKKSPFKRKIAGRIRRWKLYRDVYLSVRTGHRFWELVVAVGRPTKYYCAKYHAKYYCGPR